MDVRLELVEVCARPIVLVSEADELPSALWIIVAQLGSHGHRASGDEPLLERGQSGSLLGGRDGVIILFHGIGRGLIEKGMSGDDIYLLPAETVLREIVPTVTTADDPLPSAGTDAATVRAYAKLAKEGHAALLVRTEDGAAAEQMMELVRTVPYSIAQRYRTLVIEDL